AVAVVRAHAQTTVRTHAFASTVHAKLASGNIEEHLRACAPRRSGEKFTLDPASVTFAVRSNQSTFAVVTLEQSFQVRDGIFIRVNSIHDGELPEKVASAAALEFHRSAVAGLGMRIPEEPS